jgi:class 3 adenylate cyclase
MASKLKDAVFLHEVEAAVAIFDLRGFTQLAAALAPLDLGLALARFYAHAEACIESHGGRLVKLAGDAVIAAWLANEAPRPRAQAVAAIAEALRARAPFLARCRADGIPELDYVVAAAAGPVLAGQIGTERHKSYDVLGEPVNTAFKLAALAQGRGADHLLAVALPELVEVEGVELGGKRLRLFRLPEPTDAGGGP